MIAGLWNRPAVIRALAMVSAAAGVLVVLVASAIWISGHPQLHVREVEVRPMNAASPSEAAAAMRFVRDEDLRAALEPLQNETLLTAALPELRDRLERLHWVRRAALRRVWPNRVVVLLETQAPAAAWRENQLLNARGEPFDPAPWTIAEVGAQLGCALPRLRGPEESAPLVLQQARQWQSRLGEVPLLRLELSDTRSWRMDVAVAQKALSLDLGRQGLKPDADQRVMQSLKTIEWLESQLEAKGRRLVGLDLRYARGYAVRTASAADPVSTSTPSLPRQPNNQPSCLETPTI